VRLVDLSRASQSLIAEEEGLAYRVGLRAAALVYEHFPAFYAATALDAKPITPWLLPGCCAAFWQLVEQKGLELRWPGDPYGEGLTRYELAPTPEQTLIQFDGVSPEWMCQLSHNIHVPRPVYHGYGVQALLDQESDNYPYEVLTVALWHLFQHTPLGLGVPIAPMAANIDEDLASDVFRIKPLPSNTPLNLLWSILDLKVAGAAGVKANELIGYAFGKTANDLADYDEYEVEAVYMGEVDEGWDWGDIDRLIVLQREAKWLEETYAAWAQQVRTLDDVRRLAHQLHKAARAAERELQEPPKTLLTLLGHDYQEEAVMA
jgi:hypothetical protein